MLITNRPKSNFTTFTDVAISLPYSFKTKEAEQLSIKAFDLKKSRQFDEAIELYKKAISIEQDNPKLFFDMAECYASTDRLIIAVHLMDTAISLDSLYAPFYSNRGLYNYKLYNDQDAINDYKKAIKLDAKNDVFHINLASVYYSNNNFSEACAEFKLAILLGTTLDDLKGQPEVEKLKDLCK